MKWLQSNYHGRCLWRAWTLWKAWRGRPLGVRLRLLWAWVPPIAGGANVASTLTDSGIAHISGSYNWSISATNFSGIDLQAGGLGAQFVPANIVSDINQEWGGADEQRPYPGLVHLVVGIGLVAGLLGAQTYLNGDPIGQTLAAATWRDSISQGQAVPQLVATRGLVSWTELEVPFVATRGLISWTELEVPLAPTRGLVSWAELEAPLAPTRGRIAWAELEVPFVATRGLLSWVELETPEFQATPLDDDRPGRLANICGVNVTKGLFH